MEHNISKSQLAEALAAAGSAHHEYETVYLNGVRDRYWAGFYAAFVLGRLGAFAKPTDLTRWLEEAPYESDWASQTADYVLSMRSS